MQKHDPDPSTRSRGQAFTLEAVVASVVVLGSLLFALQVAGITSLSASTSGQALQQEEATTAGVLDAARANETIQPAVLAWDGGEPYTSGSPTAFGTLLAETLGNRSLAYNVNFHYIDEDGNVKRDTYVRNGVPSDDAARATRTVTLYDDEIEGGFYMPDAYPDDPTHNVVRVEVVVWPV